MDILYLNNLAFYLTQEWIPKVQRKKWIVLFIDNKEANEKKAAYQISSGNEN